MNTTATKNPNTATNTSKDRPSYPFDLQEVLRKARSEHLGTLGANPFRG
jgi:hypothetical protein